MKGPVFHDGTKKLYFRVTPAADSAICRFSFFLDGTENNCGRAFYSGRDLLTPEELDIVIACIQSFLDGTMTEPVKLQFSCPVLIMDFHPVTESGSYVTFTITDEDNRYSPFSVNAESKQMEYFLCYLQFVTGKQSPRDKEFLAKIRNISCKKGYRWCLIGNIIDEHVNKGTGETVHGTKHFSPGTKVYIAPLQWGDGYEHIVVIGKHRNSFRYIQMVIDNRYTTNWRLGRIYSPAILNLIELSDYTWWDDTDETRDLISEIAEEHVDWLV